MPFWRVPVSTFTCRFCRTISVRPSRNDRKGLQLAEFTFHPDLPGLAFVGLWAQQGSYPVPFGTAGTLCRIYLGRRYSGV